MRSVVPRLQSEPLVRPVGQDFRFFDATDVGQFAKVQEFSQFSKHP